MTVQEAIGALTNDLERYTASGKASRKAITYRQLVINTIIDALNKAEEREVRLKNMITTTLADLRNDLKQRDAVLNALGRSEWEHDRYPLLEGSAQRYMQQLYQRIHHEEGRSMSAERAARERAHVLGLMAEFERLFDDSTALSMAHASTLQELADLKQYAAMFGIDVEQFDLLTEEERATLRPPGYRYATESLPKRPVITGAPEATPDMLERMTPGERENYRANPTTNYLNWLRELQSVRWSAPALKAMLERRLNDGVITEEGIIIGHYANPNAVVHSTIQLVLCQQRWDELAHQNPDAYAAFCRKLGRDPRHDRPWILKEPTEQPNLAA